MNPFFFPRGRKMQRGKKNETGKKNGYAILGVSIFFPRCGQAGQASESSFFLHRLSAKMDPQNPFETDFIRVLGRMELQKGPAGLGWPRRGGPRFGPPIFLSPLEIMDFQPGQIINILGTPIFFAGERKMDSYVYIHTILQTLPPKDDARSRILHDMYIQDIANATIKR